MRGRGVAGVEGIFGGIERLFPGFEVTLAEQPLDDGAGKAGKFYKLRKRERAAFDRKKTLEALFFFRQGLRVFARWPFFPGEYALHAALAILHVLADFEQTTTLEFEKVGQGNARADDGGEKKSGLSGFEFLQERQRFPCQR